MKMTFIFEREDSVAGTARRDGAWIAGLLGLALARSVACDPAGDEVVDPVLAALLADTGPEVLAPRLDAVVGLAETLAASAAAWAQASGDGLAEREASRADWVALTEAWQELEPMALGPAGSSLDTVGGLDLRDELYSWPTTNPCRVDELTVDQGYASATFFEDELVTSRGLDALDTLLFSADDAHACDEGLDAAFSALGDAEVRRRRAAYAAVLADRVAGDARRLAQAWSPDGDDFAATFAAAGSEGSPYASADEALNAVFDALFYLETATQDRKLGRVLGLRDCDAAACPEDAETPASRRNQLWIAANLRGFRALFTAGEATGVEDLLRARGEEALADDLLAALDAADLAAAGLTVPVDEAATGDRTAALALHAAIVAVTDLLEGDVATVLQLQVPSEVAGDND